MTEPNQLRTRESPRQIIFEDFKIDLPISGGWGYDIENACVIDKNDSTVIKGIPFDGVGVEYVFVEKRIYEEMIIFRAAHEKYAGIRWNQLLQQTQSFDNKHFDVLKYSVEGFEDSIWEELVSRFLEIQKSGKSELMAELDTYRESKIYRFEREFYFDITSFYGQF
jgi:hypothetical protein